MPSRIPLCKLISVGALGGFALFLQLALWILQLYVADLRLQLETAESGQNRMVETIRPSRPPAANETLQPRHGKASPATAFWRQLQPYLDWERYEENGDSLFFGSSNSGNSESDSYSLNGTTAIYLLRQAARAGHPMAQFYLGSSQASGFWWWPSSGKDNDLAIQEEWALDASSTQSHQAQLNWQFAAMGGSVEATLALGHRIDPTSCAQRLPYYAAAAHAIMDQLMVSPNSRGRVLPAKDKHVLYQVHLHGGTGSRLDLDNRPDEQKEALQYYAVRANQAGGEDAARAAYTLGRYYHAGLRGAPQDVKLALRYYERAALLDHWEAAGQGGMFYLWGIVTEQNAVKAHKLFRIGTPGGLDACRGRLEKKKKRAEDEEETVSLCDSTSLTGMGILHLLGVPMLAPRDSSIASSYFRLAKEQGEAEACYYLAMMKLGWHTHFKTINSISDMGQTLLEEFPIGDSSQHPSLSEYQSVISDLTAAASKGNILAKHRLGMMYETGVQLPAGTRKHQTVPKDCERSIKQYTSFIDFASPQRANRLRRAYKQYMAGETTKSLRNYLVAAETGSDLGLLNAAFLMERGECLGLDKVDCAKASFRLWKAAANRGHSEASLRVGDFFYYGRLRRKTGPIPFGWVQTLFFPETLLWKWCEQLVEMAQSALSKLGLAEVENSITIDRKDAPIKADPQTCAVGDAHAPECQASSSSSSTDDDIPDPQDEMQEILNRDLSSAAYYYRLAAERNASPRAHFNLGFLYQWGFGLKQDFPLAKRHYDSAVSTGVDGAEILLSVALVSLGFHEQIVKKFMAWDDWLADPEQQQYGWIKDLLVTLQTDRSSRPRNRVDVVVDHVWSGESAAILALIAVFLYLWRMRREQQQQQ